MDNVSVLAQTDADADAGLPNLPRLRLNKEGNLLAVSTADNGFKILATAAGLRLLRIVETPQFEALRTPIEAAAIKNGKMEKGRMAEVAIETKIKPWQLAEIVKPVQCRLVTLPKAWTVSARLLDFFTPILVFWRLVQMASVVPQHWQPSSCLRMTIDVPGVNAEEVVPCLALSKFDVYSLSAAGRKVSLYNVMAYKVMTTFMPPAPASTFLAFHPYNTDLVAIGKEDSTIHIYSNGVNKVISRLLGHMKRITGLAFSTSLNVLVSSGADAQTVTIQLPAGKAATGDTQVQFHYDHTRLLMFHETQLAIYDASKMECIRQWVPRDAFSAPISYAAYSCNCMIVYAPLIVVSRYGCRLGMETFQ